ncbi:MAG: Eco57I restriction-modification methylase domain-containing protein [Candidatus Woesearchaeota archaeon]
MTAQNTLFNEITVNRLVANTKLSTKQHTAANVWLKMIEDGKLDKEKEGYLQFYDLILKDILGYSNIKHEKEGVEFTYEKNGQSIVRIEAKGMKTKDLFSVQNRASSESSVQQLWRYMSLHASPYGICTNYNTFILFKYDVGSTKYYRMDFDEIADDKQKLKEFVAIFSRDSIEGGFVEELYQESVIEDREFTNEFYKLFHETRLMLVKEFETNSPISREASVHFAQLFLNRLMFVYFAEDTEKLRKRIVEERILKTLETTHLFSSNSSNISSVIVALFTDLDKGSSFPEKVFGFNGGLFSHPIPRKIFFMDFRTEKFFKDVRKNSKLKKRGLELNEREQEVFAPYKNKINPIIENILLMASFDFKSEIDVNILGHIFEQSISDIEDLQDKDESRRKSEGIFYTPEYITDYICRNTIIPSLSKKGESTVAGLIKEYSSNIEELEQRFKSIKILDPACGSGAFLLKATDVLLDVFKGIHAFKHETGKYSAKRGLKKKSNIQGQITLGKWNEEDEAREIIKNSIFGVDVNRESIEVTKLSLFLKMARRNRKLSNLSDNIKQGNSLVDDKEIDSSLAFDWHYEFPSVMKNGGFDVVLGNPPYVSAMELKKSVSDEQYNFLKKNYITAKGTVDLYIYFFEKGLSLLKEEGILSYITPNRYLSASYGKALRKLLIEESQIVRLIDYSDKSVFPDASTYPVISFIKPKHKTDYKIDTGKFDNITKHYVGTKIPSSKLQILDDYILGFLLNDKLSIVEKIINQSVSLKEAGVINATSTAREADEYSSIINVERGYKLINTGTIDPYTTTWGVDLLVNKGESYLTPYLPKNSKIISANRHALYSSPKIIIAKIGLRCEGFYDSEGEYSSINTNCIHSFNDKFLPEYVLSWLNSNLYNYLFECFFDGLRMSGGYLLYSSPNLRSTYIKEIPLSEQKRYVVLANKAAEYTNSFTEDMSKILNRVRQNFKLDKLSKKIHSLHRLTFNDLVEELDRISDVKLSLEEQDEWEEYFNSHKNELENLLDKKEKTERKINNMFYELFGLSESEQMQVEAAFR